MFWNVIDENRRVVLTKIVQNQPVEDCYLAGGTALALWIGHRESIDLDWFTPRSFSAEDLAPILDNLGSLLVTDAKANTFHCFLDGVQVTWLTYPRPLLQPLHSTAELPGLRLASIQDIGVMKVVAASQRGARKDFIDLFAIHQQGISIAALIRQLPNKFPDAAINYYHIVKSLTFFDDAEREPMPRMIWPIQWDEVKNFFLHIQKDLLDAILN